MWSSKIIVKQVIALQMELPNLLYVRPEAREYADNSGNPIGAASVRAFEAKNGRAPKNSDELTLVYLFWVKSMFCLRFKSFK